jgi:UDP-glucose 4-epimerase
LGSILITGGAGYVGSIIAERLAAAGERIVCVDNFSTGHRGAVWPGAVLVEGSILDEPIVARALREHDVDVVVHCAAFSIVDESIRQAERYHRNNVTGSETLLNAIRACGVRRFVFSSSAAVYGAPQAIPMTESHPIAPLNPYGWNKRRVEEMLERSGMSWLALRYFNAAGASERYGEQHDPETHLIPIALDVAAGKREALSVFGKHYPTRDGTCVRDYVHVEDLADAHVRAIAAVRAGEVAEAVNLGTGSGHTVLEVARAVESVTGRAAPLRFADPRDGDPHTLVASWEKAYALLGWRPARGLETMIADAWRWRQEHPQGYAD